MKKPKGLNKIIVFLFMFLLIILYPNGSYSMPDKAEIPNKVIVGGELLELDINTSKLLFYVYDDSKTKLKNYDLIEKIEGKVIQKAFGKYRIEDVKRKDILKVLMYMNEDEKILVTIIRDNKREDLYLTKKDIHHSYFKENIQFAALLTYINLENNTFGAVGHNVNVKNKQNILLPEGSIYLSNLSEVKKSNKEVIGNMNGKKVYRAQGRINNINDFGINGTISGKDILRNCEVYEVGKIKNVKTGSAQLLIKENTNEKKKAYEINITKTYKQKKPDIQSFEFEVVDKKLIEDYGGIVQGMSGSPIIQNGKIIGALSHVICSDTKRGIGVYIQWMMEE